MLISRSAPRYRVYLLRFWETRSVDPDVPSTWRFSLEEPHTGEKQGFASLKELVAFLEAQTGEAVITPRFQP
jgi:hypothetical protein